MDAYGLRCGVNMNSRDGMMEEKYAIRCDVFIKSGMSDIVFWHP